MKAGWRLTTRSIGEAALAAAILLGIAAAVATPANASSMGLARSSEHGPGAAAQAEAPPASEWSTVARAGRGGPHFLVASHGRGNGPALESRTSSVPAPPTRRIAERPGPAELDPLDCSRKRMDAAPALRVSALSECAPWRGPRPDFLPPAAGGSGSNPAQYFQSRAPPVV